MDAKILTIQNSPCVMDEISPAMPPAKDTECSEEARERRRMQNRLAQRRFRGRQRQQSANPRQTCIFASPNLDIMTPALPDPLPTPDFSTLFDGSTVDLDLQYLDTNSSLSTTASSSTLHTPSGSTTSLSLPSTIGLPTPNFVSPEDLDIIMSPSDSYLHGISGFGSDDHEQTQRNEHQDLSLLPSFSLHLTGKERHDNDTNGWLSTLHLAVQKGHDSIIRVLLERNMDCNDPDSDGLTPLMHATIQGHERAVALLLSHGACAGKLDHLQRSVLHWAVLHRRDALLKIMLDRCSGEWRLIDGYDGTGRTPLHVAVEIGFDAGVEMLLQFGANLHHRVRKP